MFTPIGKILPSTVKKTGAAPAITRARIVSAFEAAVRAHVPNDMQAECRALQVKNGALIVTCRTMRVAAALRACETEMLNRLRSADASMDRLRLLLAPWR